MYHLPSMIPQSGGQLMSAQVPKHPIRSPDTAPTSHPAIGLPSPSNPAGGSKDRAKRRPQTKRSAQAHLLQRSEDVRLSDSSETSWVTANGPYPRTPPLSTAGRSPLHHSLVSNAGGIGGVSSIGGPAGASSASTATKSTPATTTNPSVDIVALAEAVVHLGQSWYLLKREGTLI